MDDRALRHAVLEELEWAPHIDATNIAVSVRDGLVRLTGHVATLAEQARAGRTAWHVRGVRGVTNEIAVHRPSEHMHSDAELARRATSILEWDARLPADRIRVSVREGVISLTGAVDWQYQKIESEERVRELAGVVGVDNRITVRPAAQVTADIRHRIQRTLDRHVDLDLADIAVTVDGSTVTLSGQVRSQFARQVAENAAWSAAGVSAVENLLTVEVEP